LHHCLRSHADATPFTLPRTQTGSIQRPIIQLPAAQGFVGPTPIFPSGSPFLPASWMLARMPKLTDVPATDPLEIYRARDAIYAVDLLTAAIAHLDFFSWLENHPSSLGAICAHFEIHARPADVLLTLLTAMGLVTEAGGVFHLTLRAREHLTQGSPWNLAPYYASLKERPQTLDMLKVLRTGKPANWGSYDAEAWAKAMESPAFAAQFTAAMDCRGVYLGQALAKKLQLAQRQTLLDIAGGSGVYACSLVAHHPHLAAAVFEKPPVDRIARESIARYDASDKVQVIAGDMFRDPLPTGFDLHLISNVLHDWDEPEVRALLQKSHDALNPNGLLIVLDAYINDRNTGPLPVAQYSVLLMHSTEGKCYSLGEMRRFFSQTGFEWDDHQPSAADRSFIVARKA
jgi:SAM-dependent methyltransferase